MTAPGLPALQSIRRARKGLSCAPGYMSVVADTAETQPEPLVMPANHREAQSLLRGLGHKGLTRLTITEDRIFAVTRYPVLHADGKMRRRTKTFLFTPEGDSHFRVREYIGWIVDERDDPAAQPVE